MKSNTFSNKGFNYGLMSLLLLIIGSYVIYKFLPYNKEILSMILGGTIIFAGIFNILGIVNSVKGLKEPNTILKISGLILNFIFSSLIVLLIVTNIIDLVRALF